MTFSHFFLLLFPPPPPPPPPPQVCVLSESKSSPSVGGAVDSALQVIVTQPSPCPTPALSPQIPANTTSQSQVSVRPRPLHGQAIRYFLIINNMSVFVVYMSGAKWKKVKII